MNVDENTRQRVQERIAPLASMFPNWHGTPETVEAYVQVLADLDPLMLEAAIFQLLSTRLDFMPTAGTIRQTAYDLSDRAAGRLGPYEAWEAVVRAFADVGAYRSPDFDDPIIGDAVKAVGGWRNLCASDNMVADRARFIDAYTRLSSRRREDEAMLPDMRRRFILLVDKLSANRSLPQPSEVVDEP
jgi:hypothetical protein